MRTIFVYDKAAQKVVERGVVEARPRLHIISDTPAYMSPMGTGLIDGKRARREDMKRAGVREVDPSERPAINPKTEAQAAAEQAQLDARPKVVLSPEQRARLLSG